jgi:hypothetical protein
MQKKSENLLEPFKIICDNTYTSLMGLAIRPQVSSEPGLFFAQKQGGE